ncbi:glutamate--cysteine ligase [Striga asiatica]|uniref:Glutamate--cysteine ligase n=1 Tax=Striga asiatica TaxID=4170 RepID=A0A5A7PPI9_STRAF|nr:glutamate--cysteine ligase [Striga asiatica]
MTSQSHVLSWGLTLQDQIQGKTRKNFVEVCFGNIRGSTVKDPEGNDERVSVAEWRPADERPVDERPAAAPNGDMIRRRGGMRAAEIDGVRIWWNEGGRR